MRDNTYIVRVRTEELLVEEVGTDLVIYDLKTDHAHLLNESTAMVWQLADGNRTVADITPLICARLGVEPNDAVVWEALNQLAGAGLADEVADAPSDGMSRRKLLRNIGLAAVAAPVVVSILAPTAAMAASGTMNGASCTNACNCASRNCQSNVCTACSGSGSNATCLPANGNIVGPLTFANNSCNAGECTPSGGVCP